MPSTSAECRLEVMYGISTWAKDNRSVHAAGNRKG